MLTIEPTLISQVVDINYKVKAIWTGSADTTPSEQEITIKLDAECPKKKWVKVVAPKLNHNMIVG